MLISCRCLRKVAYVVPKIVRAFLESIACVYMRVLLTRALLACRLVLLLLHVVMFSRRKQSGVI